MDKVQKEKNMRYILCIIFFIVITSIVLLISKNYLEDIYYITQILGIIFVAIGSYIAINQYIKTSKNEIDKFNNERIKKSIELAEYYKDNILGNMTIISEIYGATGILDIIKKTKGSHMENFDKHELAELLSTEDLNNIKKITDSDEYYFIIDICCYMKGINLINYHKDIDHIFDLELDENLKNTINKLNRGKTHHIFMNNIVMETLNNLEFFSMNFNYNIADESVVYQSLHKTFLEVVYLLYYNIAVNNEPGDKKLFTNIIELYNLWQKKSEETKNEELNSLRRSTQKGLRANI